MRSPHPIEECEVFDGETLGSDLSLKLGFA
jgi:hypothetical protein